MIKKYLDICWKISFKHFNTTVSSLIAISLNPNIKQNKLYSSKPDFKRILNPSIELSTDLHKTCLLVKWEVLYINFTK